MTERAVFDKAVAGSDTSCVLQDWGKHNVFVEGTGEAASQSEGRKRAASKRELETW